MWLLSKKLAALLKDANIDRLAKIIKISTNSAQVKSTTHTVKATETQNRVKKLFSNIYLLIKLLSSTSSNHLTGTLVIRFLNLIRNNLAIIN